MPAFITARVVAYLLAALSIGGGILYWNHHERAIEAAKIDAAIEKTSNHLIAERTRQLAEQHAADLAANKTIEDAYAKSLQLSNITTAGLAQRLHDYEVASRRSVAVPGTPATSAGPDAPAAQPGRVEQAVDGVISSAGDDAAQVIALQQYITKECH